MLCQILIQTLMQKKIDKFLIGKVFITPKFPAPTLFEEQNEVSQYMIQELKLEVYSFNNIISLKLGSFDHSKKMLIF